MERRVGPIEKPAQSVRRPWRPGNTILPAAAEREINSDLSRNEGQTTRERVQISDQNE